MVVRAAFAGPLRAFGIALVAPPPHRGRDVVVGYRTALDQALAGAGPLLVGGISLGAHVAAAWVAQRPPAAGNRLAGLLLALPAWTGPADADVPAALAARATAAQIRTGGVAAAITAARAGSPRWPADELERAWRGYGPGLADAAPIGGSLDDPSSQLIVQ